MAASRNFQKLCFLTLLLCFAVLPNAEPRIQKVWCVLKGGISDGDVQKFLDFACSQIDCSAINPGGACFQPNTFANHGSYALDLFYNTRNECNPIGTFEDSDPSFGNCKYP